MFYVFWKQLFNQKNCPLWRAERTLLTRTKSFETFFDEALNKVAWAINSIQQVWAFRISQ
jgi:reverse gyrase